MTELETLIKRKKEIEAEIRRLQTEERETGRARFWVHEKANGRKYSCVSLRVVECLSCQWFSIGVVELCRVEVGVVWCSLLERVVECIDFALHCVE